METIATPAMVTLPIGDGRFNPYPFEDAGSIPATATMSKRGPCAKLYLFFY